MGWRWDLLQIYKLLLKWDTFHWKPPPPPPHSSQLKESGFQTILEGQEGGGRLQFKGHNAPKGGSHARKRSYLSLSSLSGIGIKEVVFSRFEGDRGIIQHAHNHNRAFSRTQRLITSLH